MNLREVAKELDKFHKDHPTEVLQLRVLVNGEIYSVETLTYDNGVVYLGLDDK